MPQGQIKEAAFFSRGGIITSICEPQAGQESRGDPPAARGHVIHVIDIALAIHGEIGEAVGKRIVMAKIVLEADDLKPATRAWA